MENKPVVNGVYNHINNGGVSFSITNESGPTISIQSTSFGHLTNQITLHVTKEGLMKLADMFIAASEFEGYSPDYVCAAESMFVDLETGKVIPNTVSEPQSAIWVPKH